MLFLIFLIPIIIVLGIAIYIDKKNNQPKIQDDSSPEIFNPGANQSEWSHKGSNHNSDHNDSSS
ncbi:hypothetical protein [Chengkuizengella axinellae]|uniref:YtzI protein n=1 Tax=Chengkuizengella axinellae TaxID=3064388 RepID=A0ABT9J4E2_9BACL|nr:hypothetical protein [Chengkuizengella sp. 2205SS18-9]MDP5276423.1 hypothetical protein [Chengkuizengella sp. 2205SS18-9]